MFLVISLLMVIPYHPEVSMWALICATVVYAAEWDPQRIGDVEDQILGGGFKYLLIFIPIWGNGPIWLIFFKWVETTTLNLFCFPWIVLFFHMVSFAHVSLDSQRKKKTQFFRMSIFENVHRVNPTIPKQKGPFSLGPNEDWCARHRLRLHSSGGDLVDRSHRNALKKCTSEMRNRMNRSLSVEYIHWKETVSIHVKGENGFSIMFIVGAMLC